MEVLRCTDSQGFNVRLSGRTNLDKEVVGSTLNEEVDLTGVIHEGCSFTVRELSCESFGMSGHSFVSKYAGEGENTIGARETIATFEECNRCSGVVAELVDSRRINNEINSVECTNW